MKLRPKYLLLVQISYKKGSKLAVIKSKSATAGNTLGFPIHLLPLVFFVLAFSWPMSMLRTLPISKVMLVVMTVVMVMRVRRLVTVGVRGSRLRSFRHLMLIAK